MNESNLYESGVHLLHVNKTNPTSTFEGAYFSGADERCTARHVVFLNGVPITTNSKLMTVAVTSSAEAEVIAAVENLTTASHLGGLLAEMGICDSGFVNAHKDNRSTYSLRSILILSTHFVPSSFVPSGIFIASCSSQTPNSLMESISFFIEFRLSAASGPRIASIT